jgi:hypothetical protein
MIWTILEWINTPDGWAITYKNGGFFIEPIDHLPPGARLK